MFETLQEKVRTVVETPIPLGYAVCAVALAILLTQRPAIVVLLAKNTDTIVRPT